MGDIVNSATIRADLDADGVERGAQRAKLAIGRLITEEEKLAGTQEKVSRTTTLTAEGWDKFLAKIDPATRMQREYSRDMDALNKYQQAGLVSSTDLAIAQNALKERFEGSHKAASAFGTLLGTGRSMALSYSGSLGAVGSALGELGGGWLVGAAAAGAFTVVLEKSVGAAEKERLALAQLGSQLNATGGVSGQTTNKIDEMAGRLSRSTNQSKDAIEKAASALLVYDRVGPQVFERTMKAAADMSAVFGTGMAENASKLGLALDDPIAGMDRLRKSGLDLSAAQKDVIANFEKSGDLTSAQNALLDALAQRIGGASGAQHSGLTGATHDLSAAWDEFLVHLGNTSSIGSAAAGGVDILTAAVDRLNGGLSFVEHKLQQSPGILALLGWQKGEFNPLGAAENIAGLAGLGKGDRGLFSPKPAATHPGENPTRTPVEDRATADLIAAMAAHNAKLRLDVGELHKSPTERSVDTELTTLADEFHLSLPGLLALGKKNPEIERQISETRALAAAKFGFGQSAKVRETIDGYLQSMHQQTVEARLTTAEHQRQDAVLKGVVVLENQNHVLPRNQSRDYDSAVSWAQRHGAASNISRIDDEFARRLKGAFQTDVMVPLQDRIDAFGFAPGQREYELRRRQFERQYNANGATGFDQGAYSSAWDEFKRKAAGDNLDLYRQETSLLGLNVDAREREKAVIDAINEGLIKRGSIEEKNLRDAITYRQETEKSARLVDNFGGRFNNTLDTAVFDSRNAKRAGSELFLGTAKDIFHERFSDPITKSLTSGLKGAFGIGGKNDSSDSMHALYVRMAGPGDVANPLSGVTSMFDKGGAFGSGGFFSKVFGSFAGFFADGGTLNPGQWGVAGERGPEPIFAGSSSLSVTPNSVPSYSANDNTSYGDNVVHFNIDARGSNMTEEQIADIMKTHVNPAISAAFAVDHKTRNAETISTMARAKWLGQGPFGR